MRRLRLAADEDGEGRFGHHASLDGSVEDTSAPRLRAVRRPDGRVRLGWPRRRNAWVLENSPVLGPSAVWTPVDAATAVSGGEAAVKNAFGRPALVPAARCLP